MGLVTRIDIEEELAAAARGECLACRIGGRHKEDSECPQAAKWNAWWDNYQKEHSDEND